MDHFSKWWVISCGFTYFYLMSNHGWWPHIWSPFFRSQVSQNWCCFWPFCPPCTAGHGHGSFASHGGMLSGAWPMQKKRIIFCPEKLPGTWNICWCPTPLQNWGSNMTQRATGLSTTLGMTHPTTPTGNALVESRTPFDLNGSIVLHPSSYNWGQPCNEDPMTICVQPVGPCQLAKCLTYCKLDSFRF